MRSQADKSQSLFRLNLAKNMIKIPEEEFWQIAMHCGAAPTKMVEFIQDNYPEDQHVGYIAIYDRLRRHPEKHLACKQKAVEKAEKIMQDYMEGKDDRYKFGAAKLVLETLGKDSGYSKTLTVEGNPDRPIEVKSDISKLSAKDKKAMLEILAKMTAED